MLSDSSRKTLEKKFRESLKDEVTLAVFTQEIECQFCTENVSLVESLSSTTKKIKVERYDFVKDKDQVEELNIDKIPAIAILGQKDYGIRFYGLPAGYELRAFIDDIITVSSGVSKLSDESKKQLKNMANPIHIQVFVTPTCPYCPTMTRLAHQFAFENDLIRSDMVEITEFPHLAQKYSVMGVPKTVINENIALTGLIPETAFLQYLLKSTQPSPLYV